MAIKCCDITAGKMSRTIVIERNTPVTDGDGGFTDVWAADPPGGTYAMVKPISGAESFMFDRVVPANRARAVIRFRDDGNGAPYYSAEDRVTMNGRTYAIESVIDIEDAQRYIELMLAENRAS